jgi:D-sedoheptulose 7-phosphate isomerase
MAIERSERSTITNATDQALIDHVDRWMNDSAAAQDEFRRTHARALVDAARIMSSAFSRGGHVLIFGNGGSAADAQHMAAELVGRMLVERRRPLPAVALTTDTSALTAIANDYGYDDVFAMQVRALGRTGDVAVAISTSGNSPNVVKAVRAAQAIGMSVISMTGGGGGALKGMSDVSLNVDKGKHPSMIQETHAVAIHLLVDLMDRYLLDDEFVVRNA